MSRFSVLTVLILAVGCHTTGAASFGPRAVEKRAAALKDARDHERHLWRDTPPYRNDGAVVAYVEIPTGVREKFEYQMASNRREVDRVLHPDVGGFPANYGMVPGTLAFDGDPLDVLVLGPPLEGGALVDTIPVAVMDMDDEKGPDPKVVVVTRRSDGQPTLSLTDVDRTRLETWFNGYKRFDADRGKWARVTGWRNAEAARQLIDRCRSFFAAGR